MIHANEPNNQKPGRQGKGLGAGRGESFFFCFWIISGYRQYRIICIGCIGCRISRQINNILLQISSTLCQLRLRNHNDRVDQV